MKLVLALSILVAACVVVIASEDFYRDEHQHIYTIGLYGERVYESDEGKPNQKKKDKISFHKYQDFAEFGWKLFKNANQKDGKNLVTSSLSPQLILGVIAQDSTGDTKAEINKVIKNLTPRKLGGLLKSIKEEESPRQLETATAIFIQQKLMDKLNDDYKNVINGTYVDVFGMDFSDPKKLQTKYNHWLETNTNGLINGAHLQLDPKAKMVLSSALYFKGDWLFAFSKTEIGPFYTPTQTLNVPMMTLNYKKFHYGHLSNDNGEWLAIPYNSTDSMLILLPNKTRQIDEFINVTPYTDITDIIDIIVESNHPRTLVNITLPKFKINSAVQLDSALKKMGINKLFSPQSQYSPLKNERSLQVSAALQQTSLGVSETGSVGASASKFSVVALSVQIPISHVVFTVDRPFVAVIVNRLYNIPYFIAKVSDPTLVN